MTLPQKPSTGQVMLISLTMQRSISWNSSFSSCLTLISASMRVPLSSTGCSFCPLAPRRLNKTERLANLLSADSRSAGLTRIMLQCLQLPRSTRRHPACQSLTRRLECCLCLELIAVKSSIDVLQRFQTSHPLLLMTIVALILAAVLAQ